MLSTQYTAFLGYLKIKTLQNPPFYSFPLPIINDDTSSSSPPLVIGLDCPSKEVADFLVHNFTYPTASQIAIIDLQLAEHIICPFLTILHNDILLTTPIYPYNNFLRSYVLNSKLVQINRLQIEIYSDNIEILTAEVHEGFEPNLLLDLSNYSRYPAYTLVELINYINPDSFVDISHTLLSIIESQLE